MEPEEMQSFTFPPITQHEKTLCDQLKSKDLIPQQNPAAITIRLYSWDIFNPMSVTQYFTIEHLNTSENGQCSVAAVEKFNPYRIAGQDIILKWFYINSYRELLQADSDQLLLKLPVQYCTQK